MQPPSGGCVLKQQDAKKCGVNFLAATFGWLCVETTISRCNKLHTNRQPPSGGCVLKRPHSKLHKRHTPAATFGWLCVETCGQIRNLAALMCSHLRVAVC